MPKKMGKYKKNLLKNTSLLLLFAVLFCVTLLTSVNTSSALLFIAITIKFTTITPQQQPQVPQQNQPVLLPPQPPQISWNELEEAEGFVANGKIDSIIYTIYGSG